MLKWVHPTAAALIAALGLCGGARAGCHGCGSFHQRGPAMDNGWPDTAPIPCCLSGPYYSPYLPVYWVTPPAETAKSVIARLTALNIPLVPEPTLYLGKQPPEPKKKVEKVKVPPKEVKKEDKKPDDKKEDEKKEKDDGPKKDDTKDLKKDDKDGGR
jgi:hypothetical protein